MFVQIAVIRGIIALQIGKSFDKKGSFTYPDFFNFIDRNVLGLGIHSKALIFLKESKTIVLITERNGGPWFSDRP